MRSYLLAGLLGIVCLSAQAAVTLTPPTYPPRTGDAFQTDLSSAVTLTGSGTACTTPGGAGCTIVLSQTDVSQWDDWTIYFNVSGAATVDNVLLEVSPDGTNWVELAPRSLDGMASGSTHSANVTGHYRYLRIEARAASTSGLKVALSGMRM